MTISHLRPVTSCTGTKPGSDLRSKSRPDELEGIIWSLGVSRMDRRLLDVLPNRREFPVEPGSLKGRSIFPVTSPSVHKRLPFGPFGLIGLPHRRRAPNPALLPRDMGPFVEHI